MIESPRLAQRMSGTFEQFIPTHAYRLSLNESQQLRWHSGVGNPPPTHEVEPQTRWHQRWLIWFLGLLPIEWLL